MGYLDDGLQHQYDHLSSTVVVVAPQIVVNKMQRHFRGFSLLLVLLLWCCTSICVVNGAWIWVGGVTDTSATFRVKGHQGAIFTLTNITSSSNLQVRYFPSITLIVYLSESLICYIWIDGRQVYTTTISSEVSSIKVTSLSARTQFAYQLNGVTSGNVLSSECMI
jgi:hypothetical protein